MSTPIRTRNPAPAPTADPRIFGGLLAQLPQDNPLAMGIDRPGGSGGGQLLPGPDYVGIDVANYIPGYAPLTMSTLPDFQKQMDMNSGGYNSFRNFALSKSPSRWAALAKNKNLMDVANMKDAARAEGGAATAKAMSNLAASGGLSSGAKERAQTSGAKNVLSMIQDTNRQGLVNDVNIGMEDASKKIDALSRLPGMENQRVSMWQTAKNTDINRQIEENKAINKYNADLAALKQQAVASKNQANATANSGKK